MSPGVDALAAKFARIRPHRSEASGRRWAAHDAIALGSGGVRAVAWATRLSRTTIHAGIRGLNDTEAVPREAGRVRREGGGRKKLTEKDPGPRAALNQLGDPVTRGDPESTPRWTSKSTTKLARELTESGHPVSQRTVGDLLTEAGYRLQSVRTTREGGTHPDRDAQFQHLDEQARKMTTEGQPVIRVDPKKQELVGDCKNAGQEWQQAGEPVAVRVPDLIDAQLGKAAPHGVDEVTANQGWVSVGIDHDTAEFAVERFRRWWTRMGQPRDPDATRLLITADCGGSNGYRGRLWKVALQRFADDTGLPIQVCHFPPGASKWNTIAHRMFCHITTNWRGRPLERGEVIVKLIGGATTATGLLIHAEIGGSVYPTGQQVSDAERARVQLHPDPFHGAWNSTIHPSPRT